MEHEWTDGSFTYLARAPKATSDEPPSILWGSGSAAHLPLDAPSGGVQQDALAREILRLAERVGELEGALGRWQALERDAEMRGRMAALESVIKGLRSEDASQQRDSILASVEWMLRENTPPRGELDSVEREIAAAEEGERSRARSGGGTRCADGAEHEFVNGRCILCDALPAEPERSL